VGEGESMEGRVGDRERKERGRGKEERVGGTVRGNIWTEMAHYHLLFYLRYDIPPWSLKRSYMQ
jgi:hypothetical protein